MDNSITPITVKKSNAGRPTVMTPQVFKKLEYVFSIGGTIEEARRHAGISHNTFYEYLSAHPEYNDKVKQLQEQMILTARETMQKAVKGSLHAEWYLERKKKEEFSLRSEITGAEGTVLVPADVVAERIKNLKSKKG